MPAELEAAVTPATPRPTPDRDHHRERQIDGCDFVHLDESDSIGEFDVMVRPLSGAVALADAMKAQLAPAERGQPA